MIDEINLPMEQLLPLVIILAIVNAFLWRNLGYFELETKPKGKDTRKLTNPHYGAYIQFAGKYYN